jgi:hypothetical protein
MMQTFLPYPNFADTAQCLDWRRLGKQRIEAKQIYCAITQSGYGWQNHPVVNMWRGYENLLALYGVVICREWRARGYNDNQLAWFEERLGPCPEIPDWYGRDEFHASHRSNLLRKAPEWYGQFGWSEPDDLPYVWPEVE